MGNLLSDSTIQYLNQLNLHPEKPSYHFLEQICTAQLNTFPFENISKLLYFKNHGYQNFDIPSYGIFTENYHRFNFGGTCYTLNSNLMVLLRELGFDCYHVMLGEEHMGIVVKLENRRFYVDCGAAAPFLKPVNFEEDQGNTSSFGKDEVHISPEEPQRNRYKYIRYTNGKQSGRTWHFDSGRKAEVSDFHDVMEKSNKPGAPFMTILRCQLYQTSKQRSVSLVNNKFAIRCSNGEASLRELSTPEEIMAVLSEEFMLPKLPAKEAIEVLSTLGIDIFAQNS